MPRNENGLIVTTELQPKLWSEEPIREAAYLLRRIAFFLLFGAAPAFSPYSKRSLMVFATIGAALLVIAAVIEGDVFSRPLPNFTLPLSILLGAGATYLFWSGLSLTWTPFPGESGERYATFITIALTGLLLITILPPRVSASRLYILSGGVAIGWIMCLGLSFIPEAEIDHAIVDRSVMTLSLLIPPVSVWLIYRRRDLLSLILVASALFAALVLKNYVILCAILFAVGVFIASLARPDQTRYYLAVGLGLLVFFAPLIPLLLSYPIRLMLGDDHAVAQIFNDWFRMITDEPFRLLTGHGFDTIGRAAAAGLIPPNAPHGLLIDTWYELGLIGAAALSVILVSLVMLSSTMTRASAAAAQAVMICAVTIGTLGGNTPQTPWLTSLALAAVALAALQRGQYKTARPRSDDIAALSQKRRGFSLFPDWFRF